MTIAFELYKEIRNRYCIAYFGLADEYLIQLAAIRPFIEAKFPGIVIYIAHDNNANILDGETNVLSMSKLKEERNLFAHIREINYNSDGIHPIENILKECNIQQYTIQIPNRNSHNGHCVITTDAVYPSSPLHGSQIKEIVNLARQQGYISHINEDIEDASWVIGPENATLFRASLKGIRTSLVPNGIVDNLYKNMFKFGEILHLKHI